MDAHKEMVEQAKALQAMGIDSIEGIEAVAAEMREIINEYEKEYGEPPSADAIVWILSQHHHKDMRK
jgi:uncharacterized protein YoaH (UPF0181 family)